MGEYARCRKGDHRLTRTQQAGDIVLCDFTFGAQGREIKKRRPALVISRRKFNTELKLALVCPISTGKAQQTREKGFAVSLMGTGCRTDGVVLVNQIRSIDFRSRQIKFIEKAPDTILDEVYDVLFLALSIDTEKL